MQLICYPLTDKVPMIRPASSKRDWMDATPDSFAYRCLPLTIANSHGWEILNPATFTAMWTGGKRQSAIRIKTRKPEQLNAMSHFGSGILTFELNCLFRTEPGYSMYVTGPANTPKDGIAALAGVVETDWSPATFTMNYRFTRPNHPVRFREGEPIACIYPVSLDVLERAEPELRSLHDDPHEYENYMAWRDGREGFLNGLKAREAEAIEKKWEKKYYTGRMHDDSEGKQDHKIKLRLKEFAIYED